MLSFDYEELNDNSHVNVNVNVNDQWSASTATEPPESSFLPQANHKKLGLRLRKTASLLDSLNRLFKGDHEKEEGDREKEQPPDMKASNFPALSLQIGSWQRIARHESELIAKCYFRKHKLVWEALDGQRKMKLEFQWSDITHIRATTSQANSNGILDIMLAKSPLFAREVNPQPRKHTVWEPRGDFTNNQASLIRRHRLEFSPGILEKHYCRILNSDERLRKLSQKQFPDNASPFFNEIPFVRNFPSNIIPDDSIRHHHIASHFMPDQELGLPYLNNATSSISGMNLPSHNAASNANYEHDMVDKSQIATSPHFTCGAATNYLMNYDYSNMNGPIIPVDQQFPVSYVPPAQDYSITPQQMPQPSIPTLAFDNGVGYHHQLADNQHLAHPPLVDHDVNQSNHAGYYNLQHQFAPPSLNDGYHQYPDYHGGNHLFMIAGSR